MSTGPITPEGKAIVSLNAISHGITAQAIVIPVEDPLEWDDHWQSIVDAYDPQTALEQALALRVAELLWRLRRVSRSEADAITDYHRYLASKEPAEWRKPQPPPRLPRHDEIEVITRYESHLNRQLRHAMHELEALQVRRAGQATPLARVDFLNLAREST